MSFGGARSSLVKVTLDVKEQLETYLNENCTYTTEAYSLVRPEGAAVDVDY
ncbi:hypothetical protein PPTG_23780 [Phytophthora nicotianae INRA-310]|uniref:Uncharacterized protein n=1 Tax=Phytophthora nicotianae (strain INRA-310) TaxID=761204 RepID=W2PTC4_PHYN3|nr:hypothetical protein PPTG_23780 [Phytophthora nicotianae INRA-310]ETN03469.1 hypothetical protein PPTG_23780 [Phytophthora nicotianae INRA-310]